MIKDTTGEVVWANDNKTVYFVRQHQETLRAYRLFRYELGSDEVPELLFEEKDDTYHLSLEKGRTDRVDISQFQQAGFDGSSNLERQPAAE